MHLEYCYYDITLKDSELIDIINKVIKFNPKTISVLPSYLKPLKSILSTTDISASAPIDFPLGTMDLKSRLSVAENCIKNGATILDIVCPTYLLCNRKYDKFREDIKEMQSLCSDSKLEIRYVLEYRQFSYELLYKVTQILYDFNITTIYPSTGYLIDDISDNITASALINKKVPNINIICNGNIWNDNQIKMAKKSKIYGLRVNSLNALELITKENIIEN
jgi:deoxyribose-phosphate aldolase